MTTATLEFQDLLAEVTPDKPKVLYGVSWDDYINLVETTFGETNLKMSYNRGVLKIMGQGFNHENLSRFIEKLMTIIGFFSNQKIESAGSMSLISRKVRKGADPDESYYIQNAHLANFKDELYDDETDVPPDLVVEIDKSHGSDDKFEIYAAFGIKEFWLYSNKILRIFLLTKTGEYLEAEKSLALPILSSAVLTKLLNRSQEEDQFDILREFANWLKENN